LQTRAALEYASRVYLAPDVNATYTRRPLADGDAGTFATVALMRQMIDRYKADPALRERAVAVAFLTPAHDEVAEIEAVYNFVRDNVRYTKDVVGIETLATPDKTLALRYGDCDDMVVLLATLLESIGYPTRMVIEDYSGAGWEHVYLLVALDNRMIPLDPTEMVAAGWQPPEAVRRWVEP